MIEICIYHCIIAYNNKKQKLQCILYGHSNWIGCFHIYDDTLYSSSNYAIEKMCNEDNKRISGRFYIVIVITTKLLSIVYYYSSN